MRANWGIDGFKLQGTYFAKQLKKPKLVIVFYNVGAASTEYTNAAKALLAEGGAEVVNVVLAQAGATDYSNEISAIRASGDFDAVSLGIDGNDIAYFLKQYRPPGSASRSSPGRACWRRPPRSPARAPTRTST